MQAPILLLTAAFALFTGPAAYAGEGEGLTTAPRWQGRILLGAGSPNNLLNSGLPTEKYSGAGGGLTLRSVRVMGDYYFGSSGGHRLSDHTGARNPISALTDLLGGGFRATSGLLVGPRSAGYPSVNAATLAGNARGFSVDLRGANAVTTDQAASESNAVPYFGFGYSGISTKGGWGFTADVGVMALNPGSAVKLGRVLGGGQSLDDTLREMRVSPVLQLGVSYSF